MMLSIAWIIIVVQLFFLLRKKPRENPLRAITDGFSSNIVHIEGDYGQVLAYVTSFSMQKDATGLTRYTLDLVEKPNNN